MEGGRAAEQDYDEFEILLGEIPNVTSVSSQTGEPGTTDILRNLETVYINAEGRSSPARTLSETPNSSHALKNEGNMASYMNLSLPNGYDKKSLGNGNVSSETPKMNLEPSNISLTSAFEELSLEDCLGTKPKHNNAFFDCTFVLNEEHSSSNKFPSGFDEVQTSMYSTSQIGTTEMPNFSPFGTRNGLHFSAPESEAYRTLTGIHGDDGFCTKMDAQNEMEYKTKPEHAQSHFSAGYISLNAENHACKLLPGVPFPGMDLTGSPFHQQYYLNAQSRGCVWPPNFSRFNIAWQSMEGERCYDLHQHSFYSPHLQNRGLQPHQISNGTVSGIWPSTGSNMEPYFRLPVSHHIQNFKGNAYSKDNFHPKGCNDFIFSATEGNPYQLYSQDQKLTSANGLYTDCPPPQFMEKKQVFPEKILTKSDGVNMLRTLRSSSTEICESPLIADSNRKLHLNGHLEQHIIFDRGCLWLDGPNCQGSSPSKHNFIASPSAQLKCNNFIDNVQGRIYSMAKDQIGCRFLQKKIAESSPEDIEKIFYEVISHIIELMTDPFGNYLVQKLLEVCNKDQRMCILHAITRKPGELFRISCDVHGAVQKVIETLQTAEQYHMVIASLKPCVVPLIKNVNGNHVVQCCLQHFPAEYSAFLFDAAVTHCVDLATDRQGCCVLQKCLHHSDGDPKDRLITEITSNSLFLSEDRYGNYVVQFILDKKVPWATSIILNQLEGNYTDLSMQKCSSNVVEKCLRLSEEEDRARIIHELMKSPGLLQILQDPFGNYVIQSALRECRGALRIAFIEAIRPHFPALRNSPYGRKVLSSICPKK